MDTPQDFAAYRIDREIRRRRDHTPCSDYFPISKTDELCEACLWGKDAHESAWIARNADEHYPECPISIAAEKGRISTLCMCAKIEIAEDSIRDDGSSPEPIDHREER